MNLASFDESNRAVEKILTALLTDPEVRQAARDCGIETKGAK